MTNLSRITAKIFGETATATGDDPEIGQFGSALAGTYVGTADVATIQGLSAWSNGFIDSVTPSTQFPPLPEMTGFGKVLSYQTAYTMQKGVAEWDSGTTYYTGDFCKGVGEGKLYVSLADNNLNHAVSDTTYWEEFSSGGGASRNIGEIVASTIPLTDAGLHLLDGALIQGSGSYSAFVDYMADLYNTDPTADYFAQDVNPQPESFVQPVLSSNGTLGGNAFAVAGDSTPGEGNEVWQAFDNNASTWWAPVKYANPNGKSCIFYNPEPFNITQIQVKNRALANIAVTGGIIYGSNDNSTWTELTTFTNSSKGSGATWTIDLSSNTNYYKYYKFYITGGGYTSTASTSVASFDLTATYLEPSQTAEEWWQEQVTTYGVCGKFVYNSVNNTVRLPKITGILEGTTDLTALGDLVEAGLPNITGELKNQINTSELSGAFYNTRRGSNVGDFAVRNNSLSAGFNASRSNSIYGNSNTVQPQTIKVLYYIVVATTTKTEIEVDIDEIATDLNGKADVDLTNCTKPHIVETYQNGDSWYRVYSDKWCEQGGNTGTAMSTITLLKPYRDTNYTVLQSVGAVGGTQYHSITTRTTTSFSMNGTNTSHFWRAEGYIS